MKDVLLIKNCVLCGESHFVGLDIKKSPFASAGSRMPTPKRFSRVLICNNTQRKFKLETYIFTPPEIEYISIRIRSTVSSSIVVDLKEYTTSYFDEYGLTTHLREIGIPENCLWVPPGGISIGDYNIIGIV